MAKSKFDKDEVKVIIGYAAVTALIVLMMLLVLLEFGYFDAQGSTGFVPNCVPMDISCGNKGCKVDGDNQVVNGHVQEQYP